MKEQNIKRLAELKGIFKALQASSMILNGDRCLIIPEDNFENWSGVLDVVIDSELESPKQK